LPGHYTVRLTANGKTQTAALTVKMDPRVKTPALGLEKKFQAETKLAGLLSQTSQAIQQANSIDSQLKRQSDQLKTAGEAVQTFQSDLAAVLGSAPSFAAPDAGEATVIRANGHASTLYGQVWQVDAAPTSSKVEAIAAAERETLAVIKRWNQLRKEALPELNRKLREANLPEVQLETNLQFEAPLGDEE
jgi:hypothetical protein